MNPKTFFAEPEATALVKWVDLDQDGNIVKNTGPNKPNPAKFGGQ